MTRCLLLGNGPSLQRLMERGPTFTVEVIGMNRATECDVYCYMWQGRYLKRLMRGEVSAREVYTLQRPAEVVWLLENNPVLAERHEWHGIPKLPTSAYPDGQMAPTGNLKEGTPCTMTGQFAIEVALHRGHDELYLAGFDLGYDEGHCDDDVKADRATRDRQRKIMGHVAAQIAKAWPSVKVWNIGEGSSMGAFPHAPERVRDVARVGT